MSFQSPYSAPNYPSKPTPQYDPDPEMPQVWIWYAIYCGLHALMYLFVIGVGIFLAVVAHTVDDPEMEPAEAIFVAVFYGIVGLLGFAFYLTGIFLPKGKVSWIWGLIAICFGFSNCCTLFASIPLLIFWIKDDLRSYLNAL